ACSCSTASLWAQLLRPALGGLFIIFDQRKFPSLGGSARYTKCSLLHTPANEIYISDKPAGIETTHMSPPKASGFLSWISFLLFGIAPLHGHAILLAAAPTANQVVNGTHTPIRLRFNSRIDAKRSRIMLASSNGKQVTLDIDRQTS